MALLTIDLTTKILVAVGFVLVMLVLVRTFDNDR